MLDMRNELLWRNDSFLSCLTSEIGTINLLSLDVFDTLLFRMCSRPSDVFLTVGNRAVKSGLIRSSISPAQFAALRMRAEEKSRETQILNTGNGDVFLDQIYAELSDICLKDDSEIVSLEIEVEKEHCFLNPHAVSLLHYCKSMGIKIALLSDTYFTSEQLRAILQNSGLDLSVIDTLLVSSEEKAGKPTGGLFDKLLELYPNVSEQSIIHIGDNENADIKGSAKRGIRSILYNVIPESFSRLYHWESVRHGDVLPQLKSIRKLAGASAGKDIDEVDYTFQKIGAEILGPFFNSFCEWVVESCLKENRREIHPLMREATLLAPVLEEVICRKGYPISVKPLYVSRKATYLASLTEWDESEASRFLRIDSAKISDLFDSLGIPDELQIFKKFRDLTIKQFRTKYEDKFYQLREFLLTDEIKSKINKAAEKSRDLFIEYLKQECGSLDTLMTVDIGFNGTIQYAIDKAVVLSGEAIPNSIHMLATGGEGIHELLLRGTDIRCYLGSSGENYDLTRVLMRDAAVLEELIIGEFGSTTGYYKDINKRVQPKLDEIPNPEEARHKRACREGVYIFQTYYNYLMEIKSSYNTLGETRPREFFKPLHRLLDMPTPHEVEIIGGLKHQDNHLGQYSRLIPDIEDKWFSKGPMSFLNACNFDPYELNIYWPQGALTAKYPYDLYQLYLGLEDSFGHKSLTFKLFQNIKARGISSIVLIGDVPFVRFLSKISNNHGVQVDNTFDMSNQQLQLLFLQLKETCPGERLCIVIASLIKEQTETIRNTIDSVVLYNKYRAPIVLDVFEAFFS
ncbi:HAD family hydrolase [Paenibacillus sp. GYB003]|uniref:HAD family hydrolase n=1 Tax=Paenibacillus sp. GYB003 TaxID=2994392 RepID=UPI002F96836E